VRHQSVAATGWLAAAPEAAGFVGACLGGLLADGLQKARLDPVLSSKIPTVAGLCAAGGFSAAAPLAASLPLGLVLMSAALFCAYGAGSCSWALGAALAPPDAVATLESIQNIGGSLGGALAPLLTGLIVQATGAYTLAFQLAAGVAVFSALSYSRVRRGAYDDLAERVGAGQDGRRDKDR
jgi:sugar phosphate permease